MQSPVLVALLRLGEQQGALVSMLMHRLAGCEVQQAVRGAVSQVEVPGPAGRGGKAGAIRCTAGTCCVPADITWRDLCLVGRQLVQQFLGHH